MTQMYGQMQSEKMVEDANVGRQIAREVSRFGINENQRWHVIFQLALELEDVNDMKELTDFIKSRKGKQLFVTHAFSDGDGEV